MRAFIYMDGVLKSWAAVEGRSEGSANCFKWFAFTSRWANFIDFLYIPSLFNCQREVVELTDPWGCVTERGAAASEGFRQ